MSLSSLLADSELLLTFRRKTDRVFTLKALTIKKAEEITFLLTAKDGNGADKMVSVADYFKQTYNVTVTKPQLPCVQYGQKNFVP